MHFIKKLFCFFYTVTCYRFKRKKYNFFDSGRIFLEFFFKKPIKFIFKRKHLFFTWGISLKMWMEISQKLDIKKIYKTKKLEEMHLEKGTVFGFILFGTIIYIQICKYCLDSSPTQYIFS